MKALPLAFRMAWATRLRQVMEERGLKADALASASGRSVSIIYRWMNGQIPELPDVKLLADLLGRDPAWMLWGETPGKAAPGRARQHVKKLLLVLSVGLGLWPSGSVSAETSTLSVVREASPAPPYRKWRPRRLGLVAA